MAAVGLLAAAAASAAFGAKDATLLVSRSSAGAKGTLASDASAVSADGRYIAIRSEAQLHADDTDSNSDVYVRDIEENTTTLVSRATGVAGAKGLSDSSAPAISADGRYVAFASLANLDGVGSEAHSDVYVRDLEGGTTTLVSRDSTGTKGNTDSSAPAISDDGRYVAFESKAKLHPDDLDALNVDVYRRDLQENVTTLVSRAGGATGVDGNNFNELPSISGDASRVSFQSIANNLHPDDTDTTRDVFVRDLTASTTILVSRASGVAGAKGTSFSQRASLSADGRYVAFDSQATNLDPDDDDGTPDVYVRDLESDTTTLASRASGAAGEKADATTIAPAISSGGRYVAFESIATNLDPDDTDATRDVLVRDLQARTTLLVSRAGGEDGEKGSGASAAAAISAAGRFVTYDSVAANLDPADMDVIRDVFARDVLGPPDITPPVITAPAEITAEATGASGAIVGYLASAIDDVAVQTFVCEPRSETTFAIGTTTVECTATDTSANESTASFTVTVVDTTDPAIAISPDVTVEAGGANGAVVTYAASATDMVQLASFACTPSSGAQFPLGTTTVDCTATDTSANESTASFTVTVVDTTDPAIAISPDVTVEAGGANGAVVTYAASATDMVQLASFACTPSSGAQFPLGTTTVDCTATDTSANQAAASFDVTVIDTIPPIITIPADLAAEATGPAGASVSYAASADDLVEVATFACAPPSGATFAIGTTTVSCTATDPSGNDATRTFGVTVAPVPSAPPPAPGPGIAPLPPAPSPAGPTVVPERLTAQLTVRRATIDRGRRLLIASASISRLASGFVDVELRSAGRRVRFRAPIDSTTGRIGVRRRIAKAQAAMQTASLMISYAGDTGTRAQTVRLRAGARRAALRPTRPTLVGDRLRARGTVAASARGTVRLQLEYVQGGQTKTRVFNARIARGRWRIDVRLSAAVLAEVSNRTGPLDAYTLFAGYAPRLIGGELQHAQVLAR